MNNPLAEAGKEFTVIDNLRAGRMLLITTAVMQKNNIQVRAIAKLQAAKFPVGNDTELRLTQFAMQHVSGWSIAFQQMIPGQLHNFFQHCLGNESEMITDLLNRHAGNDIGCRHMQYTGSPELAQLVHLLLKIIRRQACQLYFQHTLQAGLVQRIVQRPRVQQLVQQYRVLRQQRGDPAAGPA